MWKKIFFCLFVIEWASPWQGARGKSFCISVRKIFEYYERFLLSSDRLYFVIMLVSNYYVSLVSEIASNYDQLNIVCWAISCTKIAKK